MKEIINLGLSESLPEGWTKHIQIYYYYNVDSERGLFLTIVVDTSQNTGIVRKGAYSNPMNKPKRLYK